MNPAPDIDLDEETAPALDVAAILALHRDPDGYIGFVRKPAPDAPPRLDRHGRPYTWDNLFSIRADDLRSMFPALAHWLTHDAYMTVHAYHRAAPYRNKLTGHPDVWRKEKHLRSLTACYADIDSGRPESDEPGAALSWRQAQHEAEALADAGIIPQPSIVARSGRGVYLFWLLRDEHDPDKLPHAWPDSTIPLYKACNRALNERLRAHRLPADKAAIDAARVLRVPGSIHRKALRRVTYMIQADETGRGFVYSLPELAQALDLPALKGDLPEETRKLARPAQYRKVKEPGSAPLRSHGTRKLNALRAQDLLTLQAHRGGFLKSGVKYPDGTTSPGRRFTLTLYANFLRGSGLDQAAALDALRSMAANMRPPWPDEPGDPTIEALAEAEYSTAKRLRWKNPKLCALLGISAALAQDLELRTIRPLDVALDADRERPTQKELVQARREWLRQYIVEHGGNWTGARVMRLSSISPYPWNNRMTATADLNAIAPDRVRGPGRRRKAAR